MALTVPYREFDVSNPGENLGPIEGMRRCTKPGAATGTCACGFGAKSRAKREVQHATDCRRAPFTPKPGHMTRSPRLAVTVK